ncbi:hypothetical protein BOX15_Mlig022091g1 [Macrostomum lignano]|uniref:THAP-type domain-containing protein n=1 Tax=Macrostomum lignano TaxID=282301 RepID=A0A267H6Z6_9PLAT|nr:hypothetical protein BOX15_Mlig022091g1 [Macrostomum lignano]
MGYKCCVFGCKSGYASQKTENVSYYAFPKDTNLRQRWLRAIPNADLNASEFQRVCSKHFTESDFVKSSSDANQRRKKRRFSASDSKLHLIRLKDDAVPSQFEGLPKYLSKPITQVRSQNATSAARFMGDQVRLDEEISDFFGSDELCDFSDLIQKLEQATIPSGFVRSKEADSVSFYLITRSDSISAPCLLASMTVLQDLTFQVFISGLSCSDSMFKHLLKDDSLHVRQLSTLENMLALIKSSATVAVDSRNSNVSSAFVEGVLKVYLESLSDDSELSSNVNFLAEQFSLIHQKVSARRYSPSTTVFAYLIFSTSRAAYKAILENGALCLPSVRSLVRLNAVLSKEPGVVEEMYLQLRTESLSSREKHVVLIIDEVATAKRIEFNCDSAYGLASDGKMTSSILAFLIKSVGASYQDVVGLFPVNCLTALDLCNMAKEVIAAVTKSGFEIVALSCDNSSVNRKFYSMSAVPEHGLSMRHPCDDQKEIFLLMDTTHNIKNVYNNFQRRGVFHCPAFDNCSNFVARFSDVEAIFEIERGQSSKIAFRLSEKVLRPLNVERTSASLAAAVFDDTTVSALRLYSSTKSTEVDTSTFNSTANFLSMIRKLWAILNVRTPFAGQQLRRPESEPLTNMQDWQLQYLADFVGFLKKWRAVSTGADGLTNETFGSLIQTCSAIPLLCAKLFSTGHFDYILLGKLLSDPLERQFGKYRQMSGGLYFISAKQVVQSENKLRMTSLLKHSEIDLLRLKKSFMKDVEQEDTDVSLRAAEIFADVSDEPCMTLRSNEMGCLNVMFYIAGYLSKSISKGCADCREFLVSEDKVPPMEVTLDDAPNRDFLVRQSSRGGLCCPSDSAFVLCMTAFNSF